MFSGHQVSVGKDEKVLEIDVVMAAQWCECNNANELKKG